MKFVEYQDISKNRIREFESDKIRIHQTWYHLPCAINALKVVTNETIELSLSESTLLSLTNIETANLIIVGRPNNQLIFDAQWQQLTAKMHQRGIGLEQMGVDAAVRTFNVLMTEDRPFWMLLLAD